MLVGLTTTKVHFIHFDLTIQFNLVSDAIETTNLMENEPSGLLCNCKVTSKLV